nr:hypothetical protein [Paraburkholderia sp. BL8N3]
MKTTSLRNVCTSGGRRLISAGVSNSQNPPFDVRSQLFALDLASRAPLKRGAALGWDAARIDPLLHCLRAYVEQARNKRLAAPRQGRASGLFLFFAKGHAKLRNNQVRLDYIKLFLFAGKQVLLVFFVL